MFKMKKEEVKKIKTSKKKDLNIITIVKKQRINSLANISIIISR